MKLTSQSLVGLFSLALVVAGCAVNSNEVMVSNDLMVEAPSTAAVDVAAEPTPTEVPAEPTATPVPTAVPALTADEQIDAAIAEYDRNPLPAGIENWDHVGAEVLDQDRVRLEVCVWDGTSIFETRQLIEYSVERDTAGTTATTIFNNELTASCESQSLTDSLFAALENHDTYWRAILEDPQTFDAEAAREFLSDELIELNSETLDVWIADGSYWKGPGYDGQLPGSAVADVLWRRYESDAGVEVVEVIGCREMEPDFGLYQDDQLINDFLNGEPGPHTISVYMLSLVDGSWIVSGQDPRSWADCTGFGDAWLDVVNEWKPIPIGWQVLREEQ